MRQTQLISKHIQVAFTRIKSIQLDSAWVPASITIDGNNITYNMRITDCCSPPDNCDTFVALTMYKPTQAFAIA